MGSALSSLTPSKRHNENQRNGLQSVASKKSVESHPDETEKGFWFSKKAIDEHWSAGPSPALLLGCGAVLLCNHVFGRNERNQQWFTWGAGLMALIRIIQGPGSNELSAKRLTDTGMWVLIYATVFPAPTSSASIQDYSRNLRLAVAGLLGLQLWQHRGGQGNGHSNADKRNAVTDQQGQNADDASCTDITGDSNSEVMQRQSGSRLGGVMLANKKAGESNTQPTALESTATSNALNTVKTNKRYLEILVHNVSHTDLVLGLDAPLARHSPEVQRACDAAQPDHSTAAEQWENLCLCRPRFSFFDHYCRSLLHNLTDEDTMVSFPRYQRCVEHPRYSIMKEPTSDRVPIRTGLSFSNPEPVVASLCEVRLRGRDSCRVQLQPNATKTGEQFAINHVFFPLLATLLPRWESQIAEKQYRGRPVKRVIILVSGVGTPRNWTHSVEGNSTQACADLMEHFVSLVDPDITVVKIHSSTNIFRYDDNLQFVQREFMPVVNAYRDAHARGLPYPDEEGGSTDMSHSFDVEWAKSFSVTLSFADGSPARTYAIQAGLRPYRPTYAHFWQLKTFWHESKIVDDDLEVYSFEEMDTSPAIDIEHLTDPLLWLVVQEMIKFKDEMMTALRSGQNDIRRFWLRKTQKPVLAVLLVQNPDDEGKPVVYRGTNMEVSMPTGSLCAERNVIGTALADNPSLKREHLTMIAVLAIPPPTQEYVVTSGGVSVSTLAGAGEDMGAGLRRVNSAASLTTTLAGSVTDFQTDRKISIGSEGDEWTNRENLESAIAGVGREVASMERSYSHPAIASIAAEEETPIRKISLFHAIPETLARKKPPKKTLVVQSSRDLNPLKPCGACNEWLKKIAECNPDFQVCTFTDVNCNGVYCAVCEQD